MEYLETDIGSMFTFKSKKTESILDSKEELTNRQFDWGGSL